MARRTQGILFINTLRAAWLANIILFVPCLVFAEASHSNVICSDELTQTHRNELVKHLRKITGWSDLHFDRGRLRTGTIEPFSGSNTARQLVKNAISGTATVRLDNAGSSSDVVFARVVEVKSDQAGTLSSPTFIVQIDFSDFEHVMGDDKALEAFNAGWVLLHEFDHIVNDSEDAASLVNAGDCEDHINRMRRECDLPVRTLYYATFLPVAEDTSFITRWVRLAFDREKQKPGTKKRYWLFWDASLVGGLDDQKQIASLR